MCELVEIKQGREVKGQENAGPEKGIVFNHYRMLPESPFDKGIIDRTALHTHTYIHIVVYFCIFTSYTGHWHDPIYPTPPLGQDMTQSQFLSGV